jgi:beta-lactamase class D
MRVDEAPGVRFYAKTGWSTWSEPEIGWYLGYLETCDGTWVFALNLGTRDAADLPLRQRLVLQALDAEGLVPTKLTR